jgi:hypothetical protein
MRAERVERRASTAWASTVPVKVFVIEPIS